MRHYRRKWCLSPWVLRISYFILLNVPASATHAQWVAYNDFSWLAPPGSYNIFGAQGGLEMDPDYRIVPGDSSSKLERVTLFTDGNYAGSGVFVDSAFSYMPDPVVEPQGPNLEQATGGFLRNYDTGATLPVQVDVKHTGTTFTWSKQQGATVAEAPGTDAYAEFFDQATGAPIIGLWGTLDGHDVNSTLTVTLSNLDPNKFYEYVTFGNFGHWNDLDGGQNVRSGVTWRWTEIEGYDPEGFQNLSSVDTDYATAINVDAGDPNDPRHSVGHEQRSIIRSVDDSSHYVQASGEIYFDGWVTKFHFKPGEDGTVDIVTRGINNASSMEYVTISDSTDPAGVPIWRHEVVSEPGEPTQHLSTRVVENLVHGDITDPNDPDFGANYSSGWREHSDPSKWPADPDMLELTLGQSTSNGDPATSHWYLAGFKLSELATPIEDADFDGDGDVDGQDFLAWQRGFGLASGASLSDGDANGDGAVNAGDLSIWQSQYGTNLAATAQAVPEPSSFFPIVFAVVWYARRRAHPSAWSLSCPRQQQ